MSWNGKRDYKKILRNQKKVLSLNTRVEISSQNLFKFGTKPKKGSEEEKQTFGFCVKAANLLEYSEVCFFSYKAFLDFLGKVLPVYSGK